MSSAKPSLHFFISTAVSKEQRCGLSGSLGDDKLVRVFVQELLPPGDVLLFFVGEHGLVRADVPFDLHAGFCRGRLEDVLLEDVGVEFDLWLGVELDVHLDAVARGERLEVGLHGPVPEGLHRLGLEGLLVLDDADELAGRLEVLCNVGPERLQLIRTLAVVEQPHADDEVEGAGFEPGLEVVERLGTVGHVELELIDVLGGGLADLDHLARDVDADQLGGPQLASLAEADARAAGQVQHRSPLPVAEPLEVPVQQRPQDTDGRRRPDDVVVTGHIIVHLLVGGHGCG